MAEERQGHTRPFDTPDELEQYRRNQEWEYQQFVAAQDIYAGNALAYREGDPVPVSNVELHGYDKWGMVRLSDKAAAAAKPDSKEEEVE